MDEITPFISTGKIRDIPYPGFNSNSQNVQMRDGIKIALDVLLPKGLKIDKKLPTILIQTRYWRAIQLKKPFCWFIDFATNPMPCKNMVKYGYALVIVDSRGTGASEGNRENPLSLDEIKDSSDIIDWIIDQPWSDGNVVVWGNSYTGMTAECTLSQNHPSVKGGIIKHDPWDLYTDAFYPGGCYNEGFIYYWSGLGKGLDTTKGKALTFLKPIKPIFALLVGLAAKGVKPVTNRKDLERIAQIHVANKYPENYGSVVTFRDDPANEKGMIVDEISIFSHNDRIQESGVPMYCYGSWMDSNTANLVISRFLTLSNPQKAIIGDWDHPAHNRANPYYKPTAHMDQNNKEQVAEWIAIFDEILAGNSPKEKILYYFTMGEQKWKITKQWPPEGISGKKWYLKEDNMISTGKPKETPGAAKDIYEVDFNATTGIRNRWYTLLTTEVDYTGQESEDIKRLVYESEPISKDIEVTGHPIVDLYVSTTHDDGIICVYLEIVDGDGKVRFITDGQLRFMHRKISKDKPPYKIPYPYHSFLKEDALPVIPGEVMQVKFALYPTSVLIKKGCRIRLAVAGADKDSFRRTPSEGDPTLTIFRDGDHPSSIELPIKG